MIKQLDLAGIWDCVLAGMKGATLDLQLAVGHILNTQSLSTSLVHTFRKQLPKLFWTCGPTC